MAQLTRDDVLKLAQLARLKLSDEELANFAEEISAILEYVEQLQSLNLEDIEPTYQVTGLTNIMRPDKVIAYGVAPDELLKNAPAIEGGNLKVKRMLT
jgi:aspartyl-tRNA(Asn)/glutamyl-tRNA(Gln) amidotransferase subunit C